jgi:hypothetical protein
MDYFIAAFFILFSVIYLVSFERYNLRSGNKAAAAGAALLAFLSVAVPFIVLFVK